MIGKEARYVNEVNGFDTHMLMVSSLQSLLKNSFFAARSRMPLPSSRNGGTTRRQARRFSAQATKDEGTPQMVVFQQAVE